MAAPAIILAAGGGVTSKSHTNSLQSTTGRLGLRAGELVEVLSEQEILKTLDEQGRLGALPFMPEMLQYCSRRFRVFKRADKTCVRVEMSGNRWMRDAVHLEGVRCNGRSHGGFEAACLIFWNEAWLRRVDSAGPGARQRRGAPN